ncbi:17060_t:CDS:1 [Gigaspora rosea]|nr:17060_t:CDS:1 [Gigaspora rosea]
MKDFYVARNSLTVLAFEARWEWLLEKYSYRDHVKNYLQNTLYSSKTSWAKAYTNKVFTAGIQSTSRVESYNSAIKRSIFNSNTNLLELAEVLETQIRKEDENTQYLYWKTNIPNTFAIKVSQELFPDIDELLICFLSPTVLKIQRDEIKKP